jgi:hypothetical protein
MWQSESTKPAAEPLTEAVIAKEVRSAKAAGTRRDLRDPGHRGLWLRIGKTGSKTWVLRARDRAGKPHWFKLGDPAGRATAVVILRNSALMASPQRRAAPRA